MQIQRHSVSIDDTETDGNSVSIIPEPAIFSEKVPQIVQPCQEGHALNRIPRLEENPISRCRGKRSKLDWISLRVELLTNHSSPP
jgi:hypothetical protein